LVLSASSATADAGVGAASAVRAERDAQARPRR